MSMALSFRRDEGRVAEAAQALLLSALIYGFAYLLIGIAMNARYFYWTYVATQAAAIMLACERVFVKKQRVSYFLAAPLLIVVVVGYAFRLGNVSIFVQ